MEQGLGRSVQDLDLRIGAQIRAFRVESGMTQARLAEACGVSYQQIRKYENGENRISASMLHIVARVLDVPISRFFGLPDTDLPAGSETILDFLKMRGAQELVAAFLKAPPVLRAKIVELVRVLGASAPETGAG